jgi:HTH-type transcriptional regulator, sugar sensing transcriptional regulator
MIDILRDFGLNEREAKVYLQVLKDQGETASTIAKRTKINRTTTYLELNNLIEKGLVSYIIKNNKKSFQAVEPEKFLEILEEKKQKITKILPQLKGLHKSITPFKIEILEGKEGVKNFYKKVINTSKEVFAFGVTGNSFDLLIFEIPHLIKEAKIKGLKLKYLANENAKSNLKKLPKKIVEIKYLPKKISSNITTAIYNDNIAIQSLVEDNIFILIINDKDLSLGYKNYFNYMWNLTK